MKLSAKIKLTPTPEQHIMLLETLKAGNALCNEINEVVWEQQQFGRSTIQKLVYHQLREETGLTAQFVIRCIAKVSDAYRKDKKTKRDFREHGALGYDDRILMYRDEKQFVSIWTVEGRQYIPYVAGEHQINLLKHRQGESDLIYCKRKDCFYLIATCDIPDGAKLCAKEWLGVDLGQTNIATTNDGAIYTSEIIERNRAKHQKLRSDLQKIGNLSSKRKLKRLAGKQQRFQRDVNHVLSKRLVSEAKRTNRGIALEDLTYITARTRVKGKENRAKRSNWSFRQLRDFISYKSQVNGVQVILVDPKYTSQRCFECGHVEKANRKSQSEFQCKACGHTAHADVNAAKNISRAAVRQPIVSVTTHVFGASEGVLETSPCL